MITTPANGRAAASPSDDRAETPVGGCNGFLKEEGHFVWEVDNGASRNYKDFGVRMAVCPDLYRNTSEGHGLILVLPSGQTRLITKASEFAPVIADRISMVVTKEGKVVSELPKAEHLNAMLRSERFLRCIRPVDEVVRSPYYLDDFTSVRAGYHDGGPGRRILYVGQGAEISDSLDTLLAFLDVMNFATNADRTNAVVAYLTVLLRHRWPGEKPVVLVTATKSHAGKGTITEFLRGAVAKADILYENLDWPMQSQLQRQVKADPDIGVVVLDNVRLDSAGGGRFIRSAFIESFVTSAELILASPGAGDALRLAKKCVVVVNTNDGSLSTDLLNRSLPIHLAPRGGVQDRRTPIGNPKLEFLPRNRGRIEAELRGMIERWRLVGGPLDESVRHSMTPWARTIGGILRVSGFEDFLANQNARKATDEPIRRAIGILGVAAKPGVALRPGDWAKLAVEHSLIRTLIPTNERDTEKGRQRAIGVLLSPLRGETFEASTETRRYRLRLEGGLRRWEPRGNPHVRYRFEILEEHELPVEGEPCAARAVLAADRSSSAPSSSAATGRTSTRVNTPCGTRRPCRD
jgi:hypothetical protein